MDIDSSFIGQNIKALRRQARNTKRTPEQLQRDAVYTAYANLPIGRLANELLTEIFFLVMETETRSVQFLMNVCEIWEKVILRCPRLNSSIRFPMSRKDIQSLCKRAGGYPLSIIYKNERRKVMQRNKIFLDEVCKKVATWGHLDFSAFSDDDVRLLPTTEAPLLESCSVNLSGWWGQSTTVNLFGGRAPKLRHLTLCGATLPWDSPLFQDLRTLSLSNASHPGLSGILSTLEKCPSLKSLTLKSTMPEFLDAAVNATTSSHRVQLNELETLNLESSYGRHLSDALLSHITIRPSVVVNITSSASLPAEAVKFLSPNFLYHVSNPNVKIHVTTGAYSSRIKVFAESSYQPVFSIHLRTERGWEGVIKTILDQAPTDRPVTLFIDSQPMSFNIDDAGLSVPLAVRAFADNRNVTTLVLRTHEQGYAAAALRYLSSPQNNEDGSPGGWKYTNLEKVQVEACTLPTDPGELIEMVRSRKGAYEKQFDPENPALPTCIRRVTVGGQDRGTGWSEVKDLIGEEGFHWCHSHSVETCYDFSYDPDYRC